MNSESEKRNANLLFELQKRIHPISKDSTNPFYKSKYFDINKLLEVLKPIFTELELYLNQPIICDDGKNILRSILSRKLDGCVLLESRIILPECIDPQKFGIVITYFRRYALVSMLSLQAEDDDANSVLAPKPQVPSVKPVVAPPVQPKAQTLTNFDPRVDTIATKKYPPEKKIKWIEVPTKYLEWLVANTPTHKDKAIATLKVKAELKQQITPPEQKQGDFLDQYISENE